jgi:hypothetical protein
MRKLFCLLCIAVLLSGCQQKSGSMDTALQLRQQLNTAQSCSFAAKIIADYGDTTYSFEMNCNYESSGDLLFTVTAPQTISNITGKLSKEGGELTFDDVALGFPMIADEQLSPVNAPWIFMNALRSGYITSAGEVDDKTHLVIDEGDQTDPLSVHVWLNESNIPSYVEIYFHSGRILTIEVAQYHIM